MSRKEISSLDLCTRMCPDSPWISRVAFTLTIASITCCLLAIQGYTPLHSLVLQPRSPSLSSDDLAANGSSSSLSYPPAGSEKLSISRRGSRRLSSSFHAPPAADTLSASRVFNTHLDLSISRKNSLPAEGNGYKYYLSGRNGDDREELVR